MRSLVTTGFSTFVRPPALIFSSRRRIGRELDLKRGRLPGTDRRCWRRECVDQQSRCSRRRPFSASGAASELGCGRCSPALTRSPGRTTSAPLNCGCRRGAGRRAGSAARHLHGRTWRGKDSNLRRQSQRVYSASPLTAREPRQGLVSLGKRQAGRQRARIAPSKRRMTIVIQRLHEHSTTTDLYICCSDVTSAPLAGRAAAATAVASGDGDGQDASRSCCASGSVCSFFNVRFSIWRTRSRVMLKALPTSSSVRGRPPRMP